MQNSSTTNNDHEIDLGEILTILWAYKYFIICMCAISIFCGSFYTFSIEKKFTAVAIFKLDAGGSAGGSNLTKEMGALATLAGLDLNSGTSSLPKDQVMGREFIEDLDLNFHSDLFFNTYNPNAMDSPWKAKLKNIIGIQNNTLSPDEAMWHVITQRYTNVISMEETDGGAIKIKATHTNPLRAAEIANAIMISIISRSKTKKDSKQDQQLDYLAETLAEALNELEDAQSKIKKFNLENSALPLESFAAGSFKLDNLRDQLSRTSEIHRALSMLKSLLQKGKTSRVDYLSLRNKFSIVDQVEFRRVLGQNEIISTWNWPTLSYTTTVFDTLSERKKRLESLVATAQLEANRASNLLENYAALERDVTIAEATYQILIEQVKAQSLMAGFRPDNSEIYEYAAAPSAPSSPNLTILLGAFAILGFILGCVISLISSIKRGVYFSRNSLTSIVNSNISVDGKYLLKIRNRPFKVINKLMTNKSRSALRNLAVEIHKSDAAKVAFTSLNSRLKAYDLAKALATYMQSDIVKIAVINFSEKTLTNHISEKNALSHNLFITAEVYKNISILHTRKDLVLIELLGQSDFQKQIEMLHPEFDIIFLCADNSEAISLASAVTIQKLSHMTIARLKRTKSQNLAQLHKLLPIQALIHE